VTISYCTFYGNVADNGGGLLAYGSEVLITNSTFGHNSANVHGGGICNNGASITVEHSIIAWSTGGEGLFCYTGDITLSCCDVYGNEGGDWIGCIAGQEDQNGNLCADPLFCHPPSGNYYLIDDSPCAEENNLECGQIGAWPADCDLAAIDDDPLAIRTIRLAPAIPNPFGQSTTISYVIPSSAGRVPVRLSVFDAAGRLVRTLVDAERSPGIHSLVWDGRNRVGATVAGGIYFYQLQVDGQRQTKQVVLIR
jgi:hypothetical protein